MTDDQLFDRNIAELRRDPTILAMRVSREHLLHMAARLDRAESALKVCERYALRMQHDAGHSLDRANADAIIRVSRSVRDQQSKAG